MSKREERIKIVAKIKTGADIYKKYLLGNTFLYVFDDRFIEVSFRKQDFAHLIGVDTNLSAKDLYKEAIRGTLTERQIYFNLSSQKSLLKKGELFTETSSMCFIIWFCFRIYYNSKCHI